MSAVTFTPAGTIVGPSADKPRRSSALSFTILIILAAGAWAMIVAPACIFAKG